MTSGDLPIEFKWLLNGRPVKEVPGITTVKLGNRNSVLNLDSVNERHAGNYTCQASNNAAAFNFTSQLIVNGLFDCTPIIMIRIKSRKKKLKFLYFSFLILNFNIQ